MNIPERGRGSAEAAAMFQPQHQRFVKLWSKHVYGHWTSVTKCQTWQNSAGEERGTGGISGHGIPKQVSSNKT